MRSFNLIIFIFVISFGINSQNLVPNPSFEDTLWCPNSSMQINAAKFWFSPLGGGGTSELFHSCYNYQISSYGWISIPKNAFTFQLPRTGYAYAGFGLFEGYNPEYRENIETQLTSALNPTLTYYVEFYTNLSNRSAGAISNIGVHFSKQMITYTGFDPLMMALTPQVEWQGSPITDTLNWVKVSGFYHPETDGISYMTVGNFADSGMTNYIALPYGTSPQYYLFDDFLVIDSVTWANGLLEEENRMLNNVKIYPNPSTDIVNIEFQKITYLTNVEIYNNLGIRVREYPIGKYIQSEHIDLTALPEGIYFIRLQSENGMFACKKIVKY